MLVKGRSNYISLRRLEVAGPAPGRDCSSGPRSSTSSPTIRLWAGRTERRQPLRPRLPAAAHASGRPCRARTATAWAASARRHKECFYFKARRRMRTANMLIVNHALFISDLALRGDGVGLLPDYDVAIFDEAHTLEAVAGEHLGLQLSSVGVDYMLARLYNERTRKGLLAYPQARRGDRAGPAGPDARPTTSSTASPTGSASRRASNGRLRKPLGWPDTLCEELRKLATAIDLGAEADREAEERDRADRGRGAVRALADELASWLRQTAADSVYWIELEDRTRRRVTLACGPAGRRADAPPRLLFDRGARPAS